jgi:hypothetical protein
LQNRPSSLCKQDIFSYFATCAPDPDGKDHTAWEHTEEEEEEEGRGRGRRKPCAATEDE